MQGDFVARPGTGPTTMVGQWSQERGNYRLWATSYDAAGNIQTLRRRGLVAPGTSKTPAQFAETDHLRYRYAPAGGSEPVSNRLQRVDDLAPAVASFGPKQPERPDFSDGPTSGATTPDYAYDAAGSLTSDKNKQITSISYNYQHLPVRLVWSSGDALEYRYAATGQKVAKLATAAGKPTVRTDYLGAWQYERDTLRWLTTAEGRLLRLYERDAANQVSVRSAYEYAIKDHLGNLRVAFRPGQRKIYWAFLDNNAELLRREQREFDSLSVSAPIRTPVGRQYARSGEGVARLSAGGNQPTPLGPLKQLSVGAGDTVTVTAYGLYQQPVKSGSWAFSLAGFLASLRPTPGSPALESGYYRRSRALPLLSVGLALAPALPVFAAGVPHAYLRVLVYNQDSVLVDSRTVGLSSAAKDNYEQLQQRVIVPQGGAYVLAYVGNESEEVVYFDDISVEHRQGLLVQETEYDPYGLELAGLSRTRAPQTQNQYTWNGKEKQSEFGLGWHDHGWRFYDPALGRWVVTDPAGEDGGQESWGTYQFGMDNAVRYNDLDGREAGDGDPPNGVNMVVNAFVGLGVSVVNTVLMAGELGQIGGTVGAILTGNSLRATNEGGGNVSYGYRAVPTSGRQLAGDIGSDVLDAASATLTVATAGSGGLVSRGLPVGAGYLLAETGGKVAQNEAVQVGKRVLSSEQKIQKLIGPSGDASARVTKQLPTGWESSTGKKGGGTRFTDPNNKGGNSVRVMPGNSKSPHPEQQVPYVKHVKDGKSRDVNGNSLPDGNSGPAHIPADKFKLNQ